MQRTRADSQLEHTMRVPWSSGMSIMLRGDACEHQRNKRARMAAEERLLMLREALSAVTERLFMCARAVAGQLEPGAHSRA